MQINYTLFDQKTLLRSRYRKRSFWFKLILSIISVSLLCLRGGENQSKYAFYSLNQSYAKKTESSRIWDTLKTLGLKVGWTVGRVDLSSVDQAQSSATDTLAQGQASLTGLSISLFSRPTYGWQINPSFGFQSIYRSVT